MIQLNKNNTIKLGEIVDVVDTLHATAPLSEIKTDYKMIRTSDIRNGVLNTDTMRSVSKETYDEWTRRAKLEVGDVILSREAPMGEVGKVLRNDVKYFLGQRTLRLKTIDNNILDQGYLYQVLKSDYVQKQLRISDRTGSNVGNIRIPVLKEIILPLPSKKTQTSISGILSNIDDKIELNRKVNEELERIASTIYNYWFVGFNFPNKNNLPYRSNKGRMVYSEVLKRDIPAGWEVKKLEEIAEIKRGTIITEKNTCEGKIKVVASGLNFSYYHNQSNRPEFTITVSGSGANAGYVNFWLEPIWASDTTTVLGNTVGETILLYHFLKSMQTVIYGYAKGSAQPHVYPSDISDFLYPVPDNETLNRFNTQVKPLFCQIQKNNNESAQLEELRDFLSPLLMNGQVMVEN